LPPYPDLSTIKVFPDTARSHVEEPLSSSSDNSDKSLPTTGSDVIRYVADMTDMAGHVCRHMKDSAIA